MLELLHRLPRYSIILTSSAIRDPVVRYIVLGTFFLTLGAISIPIFDVSIHTWIVRVCFILEMIFLRLLLSQKNKKYIKIGSGLKTIERISN